MVAVGFLAGVEVEAAEGASRELVAVARVEEEAMDRTRP